MSVSKEEAKQLLERLIFDKERPKDWVQDVWGMSPTLGETAAKLLDVFDVLIRSCPEAELNDVLQTFDTELKELFDEDSEAS
ncbi:MAG: hypothetical protein F6K25_15600 [Okeania sp. SIO2G4]|uniref:hypothetical protein n=1 Tax=unclassified Okeania TaxID=2634635 RepID=UPI0013B81C6A|nr:MULTISPECIES: hypothetical protein [unclassified Okeania]NEP07136.1 hypothetical protein [Okeania sp. SIO4D6]NEP41644.1 hypothetical protein [Okeania sp. SIO2H7]NEP73406.1 hypothetical protein [Okeania sp. SIO2G5]NEP94933.1 hypothetical protein [Okeania sp. SIO2F5]NEQ92045.1 hypothetical protein [Okeania sp. SIO2G4]